MMSTQTQAHQRQVIPIERPAVPALEGSRLGTAVLTSLVSALVLVPCFWLPRIHAGDLSSHLYNAWLALLVREGRVEGLAVTGQWTNVLFDLLLRRLMQLGGPRLAERAAVAVAVLIFFWGAFALVAAVSRRRPWSLAPCLAGLAYGWTFHMGLFNFYLALGLSLWALAEFWRRGYGHVRPYLLLSVATLAHALPAVWAAGLALYIAVARRTQPRRRGLVLASALGALVGSRLILELTLETEWRFHQVASATGADQFWVYDRKYFPIFVAVLTLWGIDLLRLNRIRGKLRMLLGLPFQLLVLTSAGILIVPGLLLLPGHSLAFQFIDERMSLAAGVLVCGVLACGTPSRLQRATLALVAGVFFGFLYADAVQWDRIEDEMGRVVRTLPPGQRVVSRLCVVQSRVDPLRHMVDRACLGWCYSYANYEPSSGHFSLRVLGPNSVVAHERQTVWEFETGRHIVQPRELPLYQIEWGNAGQGLAVRSLRAGERAGQSCSTDFN